MTSQRVTGQRFRQRKLSVKQSLAILREHEVENALDDDAQRHIPKVETGVEKGEEIEHHLQAIISQQAGGEGSSAYIPTPPTNLSNVQYERLYSPHYVHPQTYIRFSSTVEDCIGSPYCMSSEDEIFLVKLNSSGKRSPSRATTQCSEDQFEEVMAFFEQTSSTRQPFAAVDNAPVLSYAEMEAAFDETIDDTSRRFAKDIFDHWKAQRILQLNHPLMPTLKFERNVDTDDSDPYVCFRRREVRQVRKTRGRDAQIAEKLKKLRTELEQARQILHFTKQRELLRRDQLAIDRQIFEQRAAVKETKRNLGIKGDDEDLINQKPVPKQKPKTDASVVRIGGVGGPRAPLVRPEGRLPDSDLPQLADDRVKRDTEISAIIQDSMSKHRLWNTEWVDNTWRPITPPMESASKSSFRSAITEFLPTPPASASTERSQDSIGVMESKPEDKSAVAIRYASPPTEIHAPRPSYRRRIGRGGRLFIDRRGLSRKPQVSGDEETDDRLLERMEYDLDSDEDTQIYHTDPYDNWNIRYRMLFSMPNARDPVAQQRMIEEAQRRSAAYAVNGVKAVAAAATAPSQNQVPTPQSQKVGK